VTRRELLLALAAAACSRSEKAPVARSVARPPPPPRPAPRACEGAELVTWSFDGVASRVAILRPKGAGGGRFPVLVALHGHGEAMKGPDRGALGWPNDYALTRALERVCAPPLAAADFEGFVTERHLAEVNAELAARPWRGLLVVCPYVPDLDLRKDADVLDYGKFVAGTILPRVARELPAVAGAASTGIDGVSLGGAVALRAGLALPATFGAVGALQPAIDDARVPDLVALARAARAARPSLALRLTTSTEDVYRAPVHALSDAWRAAGIPHDFSELPGPHDYPFNRGPGAYEMLLWQDRVLAR
jgi:hypothetical protein